jgi:hypothetical protein
MMIGRSLLILQIKPDPGIAAALDEASISIRKSKKAGEIVEFANCLSNLEFTGIPNGAPSANVKLHDP